MWKIKNIKEWMKLRQELIELYYDLPLGVSNDIDNSLNNTISKVDKLLSIDEESGLRKYGSPRIDNKQILKTNKQLEIIYSEMLIYKLGE